MATDRKCEKCGKFVENEKSSFCEECSIEEIGRHVEENPIGRGPRTSTPKIDLDPKLTKELEEIFLKEGDVLFWGSGKHSAAQAYDLCRDLHDAFGEMSGLQQIGLQGEDVTPEIDNQADEATDKIDRTACKIFEALTGIRIRFLRKAPRWRRKS